MCQTNLPAKSATPPPQISPNSNLLGKYQEFQRRPLEAKWSRTHLGQKQEWDKQASGLRVESCWAINGQPLKFCSVLF
jgi:hypothetical protein